MQHNWTELDLNCEPSFEFRYLIPIQEILLKWTKDNCIVYSIESRISIIEIVIFNTK